MKSGAYPAIGVMAADVKSQQLQDAEQGDRQRAGDRRHLAQAIRQDLSVFFQPGQGTMDPQGGQADRRDGDGNAEAHGESRCDTNGVDLVGECEQQHQNGAGAGSQPNRGAGGKDLDQFPALFGSGTPVGRSW